MPKFSYGTVAMCDAVYQDTISQKAVLAGLFSGNVLVPSFPARFNLSFYIEIYIENQDDRNVELNVLIDKRLHAKATLTLAEQIGDDPCVIMLQPISIDVKEPSTLTLISKVGNRKPTTILKRTVSLRPA